MPDQLVIRRLNCGRHPDPGRRRQVEECAGRLTVRAYRAGAAPPGVGTLDLVETTMHREGRRHWFACPACSRRAGILYQPRTGDPWRCRACYGLAYRSAQHAHRDERLWTALERIGRRLEANGGLWGDPKTLFEGLNRAQVLATCLVLIRIDLAGLEVRRGASRGVPDHS